MDDIDGLHLISGDQTVWTSILMACMNAKGFEPFLVPVDWKGFGLLDYLDIVKEPMDLGTIQTKLKAGKYGSFKDFYSDFRLVVDNCKLYNQRTSEIYKSAEKLDKFFEKEVNKAVKKAGGMGKTKGITVEERDKLCKGLFMLKPVEVGKVLIMVEELCPGAMDKTGKDEVDLNVDLIPGEAYRKIEAYVRDLTGSFGKDLQAAAASSSGSGAGAGATTTTTTSSSSAGGPPPRSHKKARVAEA